MKKERIYAAIDLKSSYASVEAQERYMDPMTTNLVVADAAENLMDGSRKCSITGMFG